MAAIAPVEDLQAAKEAMQKEDVKFTPVQIAVLKVWGPKIGWKNLMHLTVYDRTPAAVKAGRGG